MNEKDILSLIKSQCEEAAPDDFISIKKKINKSKRSISIFFKIAAAAAVFAVPVISVYLSNNLSLFENNRINTEKNKMVDGVDGSLDYDDIEMTKQIFSEEAFISSMTPGSTSVSKKETDLSSVHTAASGSTSTAPPSSELTATDGIKIHTIATKPQMITEHVPTDTPITEVSETAAPACAEITEVTEHRHEDTNVSEVPNEFDETPVITSKENVTPSTDESSFPDVIFPEDVPMPESQEEIPYTHRIFKGADYSYIVSFPSHYMVYLIYSGGRNERKALSEAIDEKNVSKEQLKNAGFTFTCINQEEEENLIKNFNAKIIYMQ